MEERFHSLHSAWEGGSETSPGEKNTSLSPPLAFWYDALYLNRQESPASKNISTISPVPCYTL